jgi:hypothetical protein
MGRGGEKVGVEVSRWGSRGSRWGAMWEGGGGNMLRHRLRRMVDGRAVVHGLWKRRQEPLWLCRIRILPQCFRTWLTRERPCVQLYFLISW